MESRQVSVTVAIPTLDAGSDFERTLAAVRQQRLGEEIELLICDSGSSDRTVALARAHGAHVIEIPRESFSHGETRNLLMSRAQGAHVAFLTQDAVPASHDWLANLLRAFTLAAAVGLAFGPYIPGAKASPAVARELTAWFGSFSEDGPRIDVLEPTERDSPPRHFLGRLGFFTDVNGCVARAAWEHVPFRSVAYAEDHLLAQDMLRAGFAKVFVPDAPVIHSHEYSPAEWMRRSFDEARAIREIYDWAPGPQTVARNFRGSVMADWRSTRGAARGCGHKNGRHDFAQLADSVVHHGALAAGTFLAMHADWLPPSVIAKLSLEGRR